MLNGAGPEKRFPTLNVCLVEIQCFLLAFASKTVKFACHVTPKHDNKNKRRRGLITTACQLPPAYKQRPLMKAFIV